MFLVFAQLIFHPCLPMIQLNKNPNIALLETSYQLWTQRSTQHGMLNQEGLDQLQFSQLPLSPSLALPIWPFSLTFCLLFTGRSAEAGLDLTLCQSVSQSTKPK